MHEYDEIDDIMNFAGYCLAFTISVTIAAELASRMALATIARLLW